MYSDPSSLYIVLIVRLYVEIYASDRFIYAGGVQGCTKTGPYKIRASFISKLNCCLRQPLIYPWPSVGWATSHKQHPSEV